MKKADILLLSCLRRNARNTLTNISKETNIPISTIFDKLRAHENDIIKKHTTIIDFAKLGYTSRANITIRVNKEDKKALKKYLLQNLNVNSAYRINNGFDYLVEVVFRNIIELEEFMEEMDSKFKIKAKQLYFVIEDIKKEEFLSEPGVILGS